jgi:hypothetical protein
VIELPYVVDFEPPYPGDRSTAPVVSGKGEAEQPVGWIFLPVLAGGIRGYIKSPGLRGIGH